MRRTSLVFGLAAIATLAGASTLLAQNPPTTPPAGRGAGRGGGRGGGGRGRTIATMTLTTTAWKDGDQIPAKYAQPGHEISPPLAWAGAPDSAASFVLVVHDANGPIGNGTDDMLHWLVWNIPGSARALPEAFPQGPDQPDGAHQISATGPYYRAPAAPNSGPPHHYLYELFALDTLISVPAVGAAPPATRTAVMAAIAGHIRGKAVMVGTFRREKP